VLAGHAYDKCNMPLLPTVLFRISSILNVVSIIGHVRFGLLQVYPALALVPPQKYRLGAISARVSYDFVNATLVTAGMFADPVSHVFLRDGSVAELAMESHWRTCVCGGRGDAVRECNR
jgi:hypothetical protein